MADHLIVVTFPLMCHNYTSYVAGWLQNNIIIYIVVIGFLVITQLVKPECGSSDGLKCKGEGDNPDENIL